MALSEQGCSVCTLDTWCLLCTVPVCSQQLSLCPPPGAVSRSSLKQPKSCNIFKALFCCLQAQDGPKLPPPPPPPPPPSSQHALLESQENGTVVKVTHYSHSHRDLQPWKAVLRARFTTNQPSIVNRVLEKTSFKLNKKNLPKQKI